MAKRRRLSFDAIGLEEPAPPAFEPAAGRDTGLSPISAARAAPIAQVVGDASAQAALAELTTELEEARASGRLILRLPLDTLIDDHLHRDRLRAEPEDMADLIASIRERGQQMPIEVMARPDGQFGLISGWRRLTALRALHAETGEARFATVLAIIRRPEGLADAYRAMVEENEIRAGLSYYERARIAALAAETGIYADARAAIAGLFAAASRAKRSKIGSFLVLWEKLDARLSFAPAISERLGLALARALEEDSDFARRLIDRLRKAQVTSAEAEVALLEKALAERKRAATPQPGILAARLAPESPIPPRAERDEVLPGLWLERTGAGALTLSGDRVTAELRDRLVAWLRAEYPGDAP